MQSVDIEVALFPYNSFTSTEVPAPNDWPESLVQYESWVSMKEVDPKFMKLMAIHAVKKYIDEINTWSTTEVILPQLQELYDNTDCIYGGDKNKIVFLKTYKDPYVSNSYISEITYESSTTPLALLRIDFKIEEQLDNFFKDSL